MATMEHQATKVRAGAASKVYKNFIGGEWVESCTGRTFENLNPADTREVVGIFQKSGKEDVDTAIEAAKQAFKKWRLVPAPRRATSARVPVTSAEVAPTSARAATTPLGPNSM